MFPLLHIWRFLFFSWAGLAAVGRYFSLPPPPDSARAGLRHRVAQFVGHHIFVCEVFADFKWLLACFTSLHRLADPTPAARENEAI